MLSTSQNEYYLDFSAKCQNPCPIILLLCWNVDDLPFYYNIQFYCVRLHFKCQTIVNSSLSPYLSAIFKEFDDLIQFRVIVKKREGTQIYYYYWSYIMFDERMEISHQHLLLSLSLNLRVMFCLVRWLLRITCNILFVFKF